MPGEWSGPPILAVDLGGTNMRVAVVSPDGHLGEVRRGDTPRATHPGQLLKLAREVASATKPARAVVGLPGPVDYCAGRLVWAPHLPASWVEELTEERLSEAIGVQVSIANDADLAGVGEAYFGAGRGYSDVVYLTISTGIGAGVVLGGQLVHGRRSMAEVGHTIMDWRAWSADEPSSLELLASGTGLARLAEEAGLGNTTGSHVEALAAEGDPRAAAVWAQVEEVAAAGVINLCWTFSPQVVVVGGGVGLRPQLLSALSRRVLAAAHDRDVRIVAAALGDSAGLVGAAGWSRAFRPVVP